jgi:hypothetical protein
MSYNTIKIRRFTDIQDEYAAVAAITPGMLVDLTSANKVQAHPTAAGRLSWMFALEDELQGKGINDDYVAGDRVQVGVFTRGEIVYGLIDDEETIVIGDFLEAGLHAGKLRKYVSGVLVGIALEALDTATLPEGSDSSAGGEYYNLRIPVQLI